MSPGADRRACRNRRLGSGNNWRGNVVRKSESIKCALRSRFQHCRLLRPHCRLAAGMAIRHVHVAALTCHFTAAGLLSLRKLRMRQDARHRRHPKHHQEQRRSDELAE